jgi:hypothetical protein
VVVSRLSSVLLCFVLLVSHTLVSMNILVIVLVIIVM